MAISNLLVTLSRLSLHTIRHSITRSISTTNNINPLRFQATNILFGEPLKKKKKVDPAILRHRVERRKKKLEKHIRQLEKHARQLKPISEFEIPFKLLDQQMIRTRNKIQTSPQVIEQRASLQKQWTQYKQHQHSRDILIIDTILSSQQQALNELQTESHQLYQAAIQLDILSSLPHVSDAPTATPPLHNYSTPDGNYSDISQKFDGEQIFD